MLHTFVYWSFCVHLGWESRRCILCPECCVAGDMGHVSAVGNSLNPSVWDSLRVKPRESTICLVQLRTKSCKRLRAWRPLDLMSKELVRSLFAVCIFQFDLMCFSRLYDRPRVPGSGKWKWWITHWQTWRKDHVFFFVWNPRKKTSHRIKDDQSISCCHPYFCQFVSFAPSDKHACV